MTSFFEKFHFHYNLPLQENKRPREITHVSTNHRSVQVTKHDQNMSGLWSHVPPSPVTAYSFHRCITTQHFTRDLNQSMLPVTITQCHLPIFSGSCLSKSMLSKVISVSSTSISVGSTTPFSSSVFAASAARAAASAARWASIAA